MRRAELAPFLACALVGVAVAWHVRAEEPPPTPWARVVGLIETAGPSVVRVEVAGSQPRGDQPLRRLFRRVETRDGAAGLVADARLVLTHASLVRYADASFMITTSAGLRVPARLRHLDRLHEVAVLETERDLGVKAATFGSGATLPVGSLVVALGDPFGTARDAQPTASLGVLEGRATLDAAEVTYRAPVLLTDAAINPGSEGGPLLDLNGAVVGLLAPLAEDRRAGSLRGHAIPVEVLEDVLRAARATRPRLKLGFQGRGAERGLLVESVAPKGLAARAGLQTGDLVTHAGGQAVRTGVDLRLALSAAEDELTLRIERQGEPLELVVALEETP